MNAAMKVAAGILLLTGATLSGCHGPEGDRTATDAGTVHEAAIVFDAHAHPNATGSDSLAPDGSEWTMETDVGPMVEGGMDAVFFSVPLLVREGVGGPDSVRIFTDAQFIVEAVEAAGNQAGMAYSAEEVRALHARGGRAILLGIEAGDPIGRDLSLLERYHAAGIRMITVALQPDATPGAGEVEPEGPPLGPFGRQLVETMNRVGIIIDITHCPERQQAEIIAASVQPVVASHSNARALHPIARELPDSIILAIAERGGMVGVTFHPGHMSEDYEESPVTVETLVDHIDHMVRLAGVDHVGFGSDFIGGGTETVGLETPAGLPNITRALLDRGYATEDIHKILGGNLLRVLEEVQGGGG